MTYRLEDADSSVKKTKALPNGADTIYSDAINLGHQSSNPPRGEVHGDFEVKISAPVLTTAELPDTKTMKYTVEHSDDGTNFVDLLPDVLIQTGAGGAGAAAASDYVRLPSMSKQHIRLQATNDGTGDASGKSATFQLVF